MAAILVAWLIAGIGTPILLGRRRRGRTRVRGRRTAKPVTR